MKIGDIVLIKCSSIPGVSNTVIEEYPNRMGKVTRIDSDDVTIDSRFSFYKKDIITFKNYTEAVIEEQTRIRRRN